MVVLLAENKTVIHVFISGSVVVVLLFLSQLSGLNLHANCA